MRETGIEEIKKDVKNLTNFTVTNDIEKQMSDTFSKQGADMKRLLEAKEPAPAPIAASQLLQTAAEGPDEEAKAKAS
jgi:hypothetical protein